MFKVLLLQAMHALSDERAEYLIKDRLSLARSHSPPCSPGRAIRWRGETMLLLRTLSGVAPVTKRRGKTRIVVMRYAAQVRLRQDAKTSAGEYVLSIAACLSKKLFAIRIFGLVTRESLMPVFHAG
jgi:hypothetical protein